MRTARVTAVLAAAVVLVSCSEPTQDPAPFEVDVAYTVHQQHNFLTPLSGKEEVPPVATKAVGLAGFQLSRDGSELTYKLIVANIDNVTQAHIHCGTFGVNGPIVLWLYPAAPPATLIPGRTNGILGEGTATNANVIPRPDSPACPGGVANLADLVEKLKNGGAYANVHTTANPPGEIRGQIEQLGRKN